MSGDAVLRMRCRLDAAAAVLLDARAPCEELCRAAADLADHFAELTGIDDASESAEEAASTSLPSGLAIAPRDAARCCRDGIRTSKLLRGVWVMLGELRNRFPGERLEILYAGCGPYAPLLVPLLARVAPGEARFHFLDLHPRSLAAVRAAISRLGLAEHDCQFIEADATRYRHPKGRPLHGVIVEALQRALAEEPQLAITANLAPQLTTGGRLVPERIVVELAWLVAEPGARDPAFDSFRVGGEPFTPLLELSAETAAALVSSRRSWRLEVPRVPDDGCHRAVLRTTLVTQGEIVLTSGESGLTTPWVVPETGCLRAGETLECSYRLGTRPGFAFKRAAMA